MKESLIQLIASDTFQMLLGFLIFLVIAWQAGKFLHNSGKAASKRPQRTMEVPPLPSMQLPEQKRQVDISSRTLSDRGLEAPELPEIPFSPEQRAKAREYLKKHE